MFAIKKKSELKLKDPVMIEGLPGIGNVGKLAVDFMIEELKPTLLYEVHSYAFPHSVLVGEDDTVSLPSIKIYAAKQGKKDLLLLSGDAQPINEESSYVFAEKMIEIASELGCKEIVTLGGVGRPQPPEKPLLYCVGNDSAVVKDFKSRANKFEFQSSKSISNIVGAAGLLLGVAKQNNINAVSFLVDTFAHPMHAGLEESKQLLSLLKEIYGMDIDISKLDKEINDSKEQKKVKLAKRQEETRASAQQNISYIG